MGNIGSMGSVREIKNLGRSGGLCLNDPQLYLTYIFTLTFSHIPTYPLFLHTHLCSSGTYTHQTHYPPHLCSSGITQRHSSPYLYLTSIYIYPLTLTKYISWTTTQLLLPIVSSKNSHKTKNHETRSMTGFQGNFTSNFSQWK